MLKSSESKKSEEDKTWKEETKTKPAEKMQMNDDKVANKTTPDPGGVGAIGDQDRKTCSDSEKSRRWTQKERNEKPDCLKKQDQSKDKYARAHTHNS